ncbi:MAG: fibronectin type III domain-containing protein, partial [Pedosphaera sp.]|nr:fibronectin type III domain-containing protein [Pedosphaera sp.]
MSRNQIPDSYDLVVALTERSIVGADEFGESIPLLINTKVAIVTNRNTLTTAQTPYEDSRSALKAVYAGYHEALEECVNWCQGTRDYLKRYLGKRFNQSWVQAGFNNSLAIRRNEAFLVGLLDSLNTFFNSHEEWQDEAHGITAAQALSLRSGLVSASGAVVLGKQARAEAKVPRDAAFTAMRKRLSDLVSELKQRLTPDDPRWLAFGLNQPGASSTPEVPQNVTAISYGFGQILATCDAVPLATHYRFFTQANLEDPEPVFAGQLPSPPTLVISDLEPEQLYQVYVSAANEAGESDMSEPASATPIALAKAHTPGLGWNWIEPTISKIRRSSVPGKIVSVAVSSSHKCWSVWSWAAV